MTFDITTGELKTEDIPAHLAHLDGAELMEALVHDCPECSAARARGEVPTIVSGEELLRNRDLIRGRRPRWRNLKRHVRR